MPDAFIVDAVRTPSGRARPDGAYADVHPVDLLADVLTEIIERAGIDPAVVDDVIGGCVTQAGEQAMNITRNAVLGAGFPVSVPATTVDRQCGSSQQAVHFAAQAVQSGAQDVVLACGVESMSRAPMWSNWLDRDPYSRKVHARYPDGLVPQGIAAEFVAARFELARDALDQYSYDSHQRATHAQDAGWFDRELMHPKVATIDGAVREVSVDETVRAATSLDALAGLAPAFRTPELAARYPELEWRVTAGNSSPLTDGASGALVVSERALREFDLTPRARVHALAVAGDDPTTMLLGVLPATQKVLDRASLSADAIDVFEVNEAFACVPLAWAATFGVPLERVNPAGGAIALGHPLGSSGTRLLATMLSALERDNARYGLQTMCEAGGMANAIIVERV